MRAVKNLLPRLAVLLVANYAMDVPPAVVLCEDESLIGGPFTVAGFVPGATVQTAAQLDALDDTVVSAVVSALSSTLAALHRVDHVAAGLERFGRPDGYAARQLKRWSGQWEIVGGAFDPAVRSAASALAAALGDRLPRQANPEGRKIRSHHRGVED